jgi:uncharacterized oligopeptide transporter (OPT) family protein
VCSSDLRYLIVVGAVLGVLLTLAERSMPRYKRFIPSPIGFGLAFTLSAANAISMFMGAVLALYLEARRPKVAERYVIPVSSGIIAGESVMGIVIIVLQLAHVLAADGH